MRTAIPAMLLLAATVSGQWRRVGDRDPASSQTSWANQMLTLHNDVRARVNVPPLLWSDRLAASARQWAGTLLERHQFAHRPNAKFGQNLFEMRDASASPERVIEDWAQESRDYDYARNQCRGICGHYTQIVWRTTKQVGCAVARSAPREVWVCEYDPPGNWDGKRPY